MNKYHLLLLAGAATLTGAQADQMPDKVAAAVPAQTSYQEAKIKLITDTFVLNQKEMDPFGLSPRGAIIKAMVATIRHDDDQPKVETIDVNAAIRHLSIQAIDEQHHLAIDQESGRDIQEGDLLVLDYKGKTFKVWVNEIRPDEINFTEYQTGVKGTLHIDFVEQSPSIIDDTPNTMQNVPGVSRD